jgi:phosphate-selective porin OprO/OprP
MRSNRAIPRRRACVLIAALSAIEAASTSWGQSPPARPPSPSPSLPPPVVSALPQPDQGAAAASTDPIPERLRKLEETNQKLLDRLERLSDENQKLSEEVKDLSRKVRSPGDANADGSAAKDPGEKKGDAPADSGISGGGWDKVRAGAGPGGERASGARTSVRLMPDAQVVGNRYLGKVPLKAFYHYGRDGVGLATDDDEFMLKFRFLFQGDYMGYLGPPSDPVHSGFYVPRIRYYFQGHFTKPLDYQLSFQQGYASVGVLNAFLNYTYSNRIRFRFGRDKAPFTYEWYKLNVWRFTTPDRSLFAQNFGLNRMVGFMAWGELIPDKVEYAAAIVDGPRNSSQDYNSAKDVVGFVNFTPFRDSDSFLKNLNFGGSVDFGNQDNPLTPAVLRTNTSSSSTALSASDATNAATVPFLAFNNNVRERGNRELWELHLAYFYRGLSLYGGWGSGYDSFAVTNQRPVRLPVNGYNVTVAYLLTGETMDERTLIDPLRRFDLRSGKFGLGAFEPFARYSQLDLGHQVFTAGLADPNLWTNHARVVDLGMNWYLNKAVRVIFDWEHAMFGNEVYYRPGRFASTNDLLWLRLQVYF